MQNITSPTAVLGLVFFGVFALLYGVRLISDVMRQDAKPHLERSLLLLSKYPLAAFAVGLLVTLLTQSSGMTSSLLVNLVSIGLLQLPIAIMTLIGTKVGSALTVQLLAFHITDYAFFLVGVGTAIALFTSRTPYQRIGQGCFGFGLVFLGLAALEAGSSPLAASPITAQVFNALSKSPVVLALIGMTLTIVFSSSVAGIGLVIVLASHNAIPLPAALALVLGSNVGTTTTALFSALSQGSIPGKRLAFVHSGTSFIGALLALGFLEPLSAMLSLSHLDLATLVAFSHLGFNIILALICMPLVSLLAKFAEFLIPDLHIQELTPTYTLNMEEISNPSLALGQVTREVLHMTDVLSEMMQVSIHAFEKPNAKIAERIAALDDRLDDLHLAIKQYLMKLNDEEMTEKERDRQIAFLYIICDLEAMGDFIDKHWMRLARRKRRKQVLFSKEEWADLVYYHQVTTNAIQNLFVALASQDSKLMDTFFEQKRTLGFTKQELQLKHLRRLQQQHPSSAQASEIYLDLLTAMWSVLSYPSTVAHVMQEQVLHRKSTKEVRAVLPERNENKQQKELRPINSYGVLAPEL